MDETGTLAITVVTCQRSWYGTRMETRPASKASLDDRRGATASLTVASEKDPGETVSPTGDFETDSGRPHVHESYLGLPF